MGNVFTDVQLPKVPSNSFGLSHDHKFSCNMGELIPINVMECLPGDRITADSTVMLRLAPMLAPIMHKVDVYVHHFFVPNRLVWAGWEKFITAGVPDFTTPAHPYFDLSAGQVLQGELGDYMGLPTGTPIDKFNAIPFAAYNKIYNDYYRDENVGQIMADDLLDGLNPWQSTFGGYGYIKNRAWQHDYFTSCLPFAQKGQPVTLPLGTVAPVLYQGPAVGGNSALLRKASDNSLATPGAIGADNVNAGALETIATNEELYLDPNGTLYADLSGASAITINTLRWANKLQEYLERNARGGTRYIESIRAQFGVRSSDKRLQRPEFLGGSSSPVIISEVLQTAETATTPQGNMAGHGLSVGKSKYVNYFVEEHGFFFSIMSVRPQTSYQQGLPRLFSKFDPTEYAWPIFANLGEQEVKKQEIYYNAADGQNENTFGYIPRYSEYKYAPSRVSGDFKSSLAYWHMGRIFSARPALNDAFITSDPTHRIFAVTTPTVDKLYCHVMHNVKMRRMLPKYGIPSL